MTGLLVVWLLFLWGWTKVRTEALLQTTVLQARDSTQEPALKNATSVYDPNLAKQTKDRLGGSSRNVKHDVCDSLNLSAVRRKAQSSRATRKIKEAVAEPIRTIENVSSFTP